MTTLAQNALTTLEVTLGELGLAPGDSAAIDNRFVRYINIASQLFEKATHRRWYRVDGHQERVAGFGGRQLVVRHHRPVLAVNSIEFDDGHNQYDIDPDEYEIFGADDEKAGIITRIDGAWKDTRERRTNTMTHIVPDTERAFYVIDYDGGYVTPQQVDEADFPERTLPYDIEDAVVQFCVMRESQRGADTSVSQVSMDRGSITYMTDGGQRVAVPAAFQSAVMHYADRVMV